MLKNKILISIIIVNIALLAGRFSGFFREITVASVFGVTQNSDVSILLLTLPDLIINLLVGGAMSASLVPYLIINKEHNGKITYQASLLVFLIFFLISTILFIFINDVIYLLAPGITEDTANNISIYFGFVIYALPICVITGVLTAYLNSIEKFTIPSLGTLIFNFSIIITFIFSNYFGFANLTIVCVAIYLACIFRYLSQLISSRPKLSPLSSLSPWLINSDLIKKFLQTMASGGTLFLLPIIARSFASFYGDGAISIFNYSIKLIELPLIITVTCISIVLMPTLTKAYIKSNELFSKYIELCLLAVIGISSIVSVVLLLNVDFFVSLIFSAALTVEHINSISYITCIGLIGLTFQSIILILMTIFNATRKNEIPLKINMFGIIIFLASLILLENRSLKIIMYKLVAAYIIVSLGYLILITLQFKFKIKKTLWIVISSSIAALIIYKCNQILIQINFTETVYFGLIKMILLCLIGFIVLLLLNLKKIKGLLNARI
ncbi:murein biosynthesis integral membrane protein MurJ [Escherichia coli]|uniref:murein biosynthesis integral membrane protein MurJ n=4 Tax=Escherichia coli TaxID=562 RepID=UPI000DEF60DF|nr:lipid II flippase MurJ [Escherichia coli]EFM9900886.1 hypothetical protein [Escherichia coli]MCQ6644872.1 hypothetical protein [Escherichia coli]